jgi:hypothetical protein
MWEYLSFEGSIGTWPSIRWCPAVRFEAMQESYMKTLLITAKSTRKKLHLEVESRDVGGVFSLSRHNLQAIVQLQLICHE